MGGIMTELRSGSLETPHETRTFDKGKAELISLGDATVGRLTMEAGWRWADSVKPLVGTDSCQNHHMGVATAGHMHVEMGDGSSLEIVPGDVYEIPPGHDAWTVGDEAFIGFEFKSAAQYAKPQ